LNKIEIKTEYIKLDQFMKWAGIVGSGSDAKLIITSGDVKVNGQVAMERGKKLHKGDIIDVGDLGTFEIV
jgi:ribosome-associated protein